MSELAMNTLIDVARRIETKELSPVELTNSILERIELLDDRLHCYVTVLSDQALANAKTAETEIMQGSHRGPLHGIPIAVKDLCFTKGIRTTCGSQMFEDWIPDEDATVVRKLAEIGTILLGKLHMTEFAYRWHHPYRPIPTNPWGENRWPGVSSSGSGVAPATGLCFGALGTDTGGSIRFPAAANGVVGLKPTYGRVSRYGVFPLAESLDNVGPLTRSVADAAVMLEAIAGFDPLDPTSHRGPVPDIQALLGQEIRGIRIGVNEAFITEEVHSEVSKGVKEALPILEGLGAELIEVSVPLVNDAADIWNTICFSDAASAHEEMFPVRAEEYGPFRQLLEKGAQYRGQDYAKAHTVRENFSGQLRAIFEEVDLIVCPTMPTVAPPMDEIGEPIMEDDYARARFTYPFNFSRNPTLSMPCGFDAEGMPLSLQLVGRHFEEALLCQVGHAYEQATEWHRQSPPLGS